MHCPIAIVLVVSHPHSLLVIANDHKLPPRPRSNCGRDANLRDMLAKRRHNGRHLAFVVLIVAADLAANLATGEICSVNIAIGSVGVERRD